MSGQLALRSWLLRSGLLLAAAGGLLLAAVLWQPPLHRELILFAVVVLMLAFSSFLQRWGQAKPPPVDPDG